MRIFLVRHGESQANVDRKLHKSVPDHDIALTDLGMEQAMEAGTFLKDYIQKYPAQPDVGNQMAQQLMQSLMGGLGGLINNHPAAKNNPQIMNMVGQNNMPAFKARLWNSPYRRARETARIIGGCAKDIVRDAREDVLLCEQQFGLFDGKSREEIDSLFPQESDCFSHQKKANGKFWARCPQGESAFDVAVRIRQFFGTIKRDEQDKQIFDVIIVCHGTVLRLFTQMWLHKTWEWFDDEPNPGNCAIRLLAGGKDAGYIYPGFIDGKEWKYDGNKYDQGCY